MAALDAVDGTPTVVLSLVVSVDGEPVLGTVDGRVLLCSTGEDA
ncbi:hypothetical protein ACIA8O_26805 [Kitasatospora sp. NPDC051853]